MRQVINWKQVDVVRRAHGWSWAEVARRMGIGEPRLSEVRRGIRKEGWQFIQCLKLAVMLDWQVLLTDDLPSLHAGMCARDVLGFEDDEHGRPWPAQYSRAYDQAQYRRWRAQQRLKESLECLA